jgi:hypothetical protein
MAKPEQEEEGEEEEHPLKTIRVHFANLQDPRIERTKVHQLLDIITIAICAVICGADSWVEMEEWRSSATLNAHGLRRSCSYHAAYPPTTPLVVCLPELTPPSSKKHFWSGYKRWWRSAKDR